MGSFLQDLRYGLRSLTKSPTFMLIAVLTLALGVGANTAIFSFVDALWLRPVPVPDAGQLLRVYTSSNEAGREVARDDSSYPDFLDLRAQAQSFDSLAAVERRGALMDTGAETLVLSAGVVSENFFSAMRVQPEVGRAFTEPDAQNGLHAVLLSHGFWVRRFNRDVGLVGRTIVLDNQEVVVLGVLPRGFRLGESATPPDLWIPVSTWNFLVGDSNRLKMRGRRSFEIYGRLRSGIDLRTAAAELQTVGTRLAATYPDTNASHKMSVEMQSIAGGETNARLGSMLLAIGVLVLLIACANVSSLFLARAERRRKEIATRMALGGTRLRLARQLLTESLVLTIIGLAAAILSATWLLDLLRSIFPSSMWVSGVEAQMDGRAFAFASIAAIVSLLISGLVPAFQGTKVQVVDALKDASTPQGGRQARLRTGIVVAQVALSLVMIVCTGLLARTVMKTQSVQPGFDVRRNLAILEVVPSFALHSDGALRAYAQEARRVLAETPGVTSTSYALRVPLASHGGGRKAPVFTEREVANINSQGLPIRMTMVGDRYFETIGTRVVRGRGFDERDIATSNRVLIVNQRLAKMLWPGEEAIGRRVRVWKRDGEEYEVVGVVEDGKYNEMTEDQGPYFFIPLTDELGEYAFIASTNTDAASVLPLLRERLRSVDRAVPLTTSMTLRDHIRNAIYEKRLAARLVGVLGALGLALAAIGLYGLLSFLVGSRTREIGIRMALGAQPKSVFVSMIGRALALTAIGIAVGTAAAGIMTHAMRGLLFGVSPLDSVSFVFAASVLVATAAIAALAPARRATKIDVMEALRHE